MRSFPRLSRLILPLVATTVLHGCATHRSAAADVVLIEPAGVVQAETGSSLLGFKFGALAELDPANPMANDAGGQTLSLFGREDLIAATSKDYRANACPAISGSGDPLDEIVRRAAATSIVIVNESHERSRHRGFSADLAARLRPLGYEVLAMEALSNPAPDVPPQYRPTFLQQPGLPHLVDDDGYYLSEAGFGRLGRRAKALGYRLLPYESRGDDGLGPDATPAQRIAVREEEQASNLAAFVEQHPGTRLLIHVGYSHAGEVEQGDGARWMAARLKAKTGIDPLTIAQTVCRGGEDAIRLSGPPANERPGTFDLRVDHPAERFVQGRPEWRRQAGDRVVPIPSHLRPASGWRVIEARPVGEAEGSVPMDRVAIRPGEDIALMLPPGRYALRVIDLPAVRPTPATD